MSLDTATAPTVAPNAVNGTNGTIAANISGNISGEISFFACIAQQDEATRRTIWNALAASVNIYSESQSTDEAQRCFVDLMEGNGIACIPSLSDKLTPAARRLLHTDDELCEWVDQLARMDKDTFDDWGGTFLRFVDYHAKDERKPHFYAHELFDGVINSHICQDGDGPGEWNLTQREYDELLSYHDKIKAIWDTQQARISMKNRHESAVRFVDALPEGIRDAVISDCEKAAREYPDNPKGLKAELFAIVSRHFAALESTKEGENGNA